jgi:hypothetical protein
MPTHPSTTVVSIAVGDRQTALSFAQQQPTYERATQVYRNTLAVLVVRHCLEQLDIPTDVAASDCWNPFSRLATDVADLCVPGLGRLECCPISQKEPSCYVSPDSLEDRIGYLVIQLDQPYQEATILGFSPRVNSEPAHQATATRFRRLLSVSPSVSRERLPLQQLQPLEALLIHLEWLQQVPHLQQKTHLSQWLHDLTKTDGSKWQTIEALMAQLYNPTFAFRSQGIAPDMPDLQRLVEQLYTSQRFGYPRSDIPSDPNTKAALVQLIQTTPDEETRWKAAEILWTLDPGHPATGVRRVLDLGLLLAGQQLVLMVAVLQSDSASTLEPPHLSILARVYPLAEQGYLPAGLKLAVLEQDGSPGLETQARERDNYIQLKLRGEFGEQFSIRLCLEDDVITESFVI